MLTPYDWQEGIGHRAQYVENRLRGGTPVVGVSTKDGILIATYKHHSRKVFEIYDRIAYSALGVAGDVEAIRTAAIEFCHSEGFRRSEEDVTVRRLVAAISEPVKEAFSNFRTVPMTIKAMFGEIGETPENDSFYVLDYDGDFAVRRNHAHLAGSTETWDELQTHFSETKYQEMTAKHAADNLKDVLIHAIEKVPEHEDLELVYEAGYIDRTVAGDRKFKLLFGRED